MRSKLIALAMFALAITIGCAETTGVNAPSQVNPGTHFMATVDVICTYSWSPTVCCLAVLIPEVWSVDSIYGEGYGESGLLDTMGVYGNPPWQYPAPSGYHWSCWETPVPISGDSLETGFAEVYISVTDSLGIFQLAFCAGYYHPIEDVSWEENPCSCLVEVTPLNLEQETWASIKSELGQ